MRVHVAPNVARTALGEIEGTRWAFFKVCRPEMEAIQSGDSCHSQRDEMSGIYFGSIGSNGISRHTPAGMMTFVERKQSMSIPMMSR